MLNLASLFTIVLLFLMPYCRVTQLEASPPFSITVGNVRVPSTCTSSGWAITYDRTTTISDLDASALTNYFVQYVDYDLNLVHYWGSGYSGYVQNYWISAGTVTHAKATGYYAIPLWHDTYQAESIEYIVLKEGPFNIVASSDTDEVIWEIRASLTCENGVVTLADVTSAPVQSTRGDLPEFRQNLVLALDDFSLYTNSYAQTGYLGTIRACQTFFITDIYVPRASITTYIHESITGHDIPLDTGMPIVDVPDDYGQPGAVQVEACRE